MAYRGSNDCYHRVILGLDRSGKSSVVCSLLRISVAQQAATADGSHHGASERLERMSDEDMKARGSPPSACPIRPRFFASFIGNLIVGLLLRLRRKIFKAAQRALRSWKSTARPL
jgi:hypothetical protein